MYRGDQLMSAYNTELCSFRKITEWVQFCVLHCQAESAATMAEEKIRQLQQDKNKKKIQLRASMKVN